MKVAIIGTGRVGSTLAFILAKNMKIKELFLVNRNVDKAIGLKMDLMGTFPEEGPKIIIGEYQDVNESDVIVIFSEKDDYEHNKKMIDELFEKIKPKNNSKIVVVTNPVDRICDHLGSFIDQKNIIGFGGQLDVNRLKFLIFTDKGNFKKDARAFYVGESGPKGVPVISEKVRDREKIVNYIKNYDETFKLETSHGTALEIAKLVDALTESKSRKLSVSFFSKKHDMFITWPCEVSKNNISPMEVKFSELERKEFEELIAKRKS